MEVHVKGSPKIEIEFKNNIVKETVIQEGGFFEDSSAENSVVLKGSNNQVESPQSVAFGVKNVISQDAPPITEEESPDISEDMTLDGNFVTGKQNVINAGRYSHAEGHKNVASHHYAHVEGYKNEAKGYSSHAEGYSNVSEGSWSHAEGNLSKATGNSSHAEGQQNISSGQSSHAEGRETESTGAASHSEGRKTKAVADWSHAEGFETKSTATYSHAEGSQTEANGGYSHTEGRGTTTTNAGEHAEGWYNKSNTGDTSAQKTIHSVGCGTSKSIRKNAHEIMQDGKHYILGVGGYDGTNPSEANDVASALKVLSYLTNPHIIKMSGTALERSIPEELYDSEKDSVKEFGFAHDYPFMMIDHYGEICPMFWDYTNNHRVLCIRTRYGGLSLVNIANGVVDHVNESI